MYFCVCSFDVLVSYRQCADLLIVIHGAKLNSGGCVHLFYWLSRVAATKKPPSLAHVLIYQLIYHPPITIYAVTVMR